MVLKEQSLSRFTAVTRILALAVATATGAGLVAYHETRSTSYAGSSARSLAQALGCTDYKPGTPTTAGPVEYRDQGTCTLDRYTVKVTTFNDSGEQKAFGILVKTLVPTYTHRGGAYAEGDGWNVADDVDLSTEAAKLASRHLDGTVHEFAATPKP